MPALLVLALVHRAIEILGAPLADSGYPVRRDVGGINGAERGRHRPASREGLAALGGVAGRAVSRRHEIAAALDRRMLARRGPRGANPDRQQGERETTHARADPDS